MYDTEDADELRRILGQRYHAVVGNPPYITPKDAALNQAYRERFGSCHRQYSLAVPFMERFFDLAIDGGFVGMITANSFMKREFGKKLIEEFIPRWDLTHVVDTSGAYIPGHGTPTVILFGRHRAPVAATVRAVLGIRGEPQTPDDPAKGLVWSAIVAQIDQPGSQSEFVSVADLPRERFQHAPVEHRRWRRGRAEGSCLTSGASAALGDACRVDRIRQRSRGRTMSSCCRPTRARRRRIAPHEHIVPLVGEDDSRLVAVDPAIRSLFPYDSSSRPMCDRDTP